ncbi:hypothetical protein KLAF111653_00370 [Klebsiella africana]|uniref:Uncharacterized protein n=1 Tax=Klebsiella africana TaxID=2489010 RepID=A0A8B6IMI6_9ENTR|nr:hypothetical protein SB5857_00824 [Klebsiella africana]
MLAPLMLSQVSVPRRMSTGLVQMLTALALMQRRTRG